MTRKVIGITSTFLTNIFSKPSRLQSKHECFSVKAFPWSTIPQGLDPKKDFRVAFITSKKKLSKLAVHRNRAERRVKASVSIVFPDMAPKGYDYIIYILPSSIPIKWEKLQSQVVQAASRIHHLSRNETIKSSRSRTTQL
ncbi:uncharacterized protein BX664DRAFT_359518 [Halteromyces radiatus]|uniref:uncharacterized protein n=1 Tax=Halteromyces radiatus TaxID=101107 RepID=UPI00222114A5|nr:uncharacterized protein BX664DRAFT_359518 [Halteromyces radiatus]KAI8090042.1 hypothetical protein BX664DRAFT_359518 [Halteromyces radiatus]